jgi:cytochrome c-type biogenesis protein
MSADVNVNAFIAFLAGILSFVSPCVLPLIPAYVGYLSARASKQAATELRITGGGTVAASENRIGVFMHGLFFVIGFTLVFVTFGLVANASIQFVLRSSSINAFDVQRTLGQIGGIVVIFFGLYMIGVIGWLLNTLINKVDWSKLGNAGATIQSVLVRILTALYSDTRRQMNSNNPNGYVGSAMMGVFFAAGWSPCIGATLGPILTLAATAQTGNAFLQAGGLLLAYSAGLGVPFLLAAIGLDSLRPLIKTISRRARLIETVSGAFMIFVGVLLFTGELQRLAGQSGGIFTTLNNFAECTVLVAKGDTPVGDYGLCMEHGINYKYTLGERPPLLKPGTRLTNTINASARVDVAPTVGLVVGNIAPGFTVDTHIGESVALESMRGNVVILNFWAVWCTPCVEEMPLLDDLAAQYADEGLRVLAVDFMDTPAQVSEFAEKHDLQMPLGLDPKGAVNRQFAVRGYPTTYVIGRDGSILDVFTGPVDPTKIEGQVKRWLAQ